MQLDQVDLTFPQVPTAEAMKVVPGWLLIFCACPGSMLMTVSGLENVFPMG